MEVFSPKKLKNSFFILLIKPFILLKISLKRNWMLEQPLLFTGFSIQFFNSPTSPNIAISDTFGTLPLTVQCLCDLRDTMSCHWSPSTSYLTFPRGGKYPIDVPLPTF